MHSASVVLPEPEPPSTAAWRFSTSLLSVMLLLERSARPARMLLAPSPASSSSTESGMSSFGSRRGAAVPSGPVGAVRPGQRWRSARSAPAPAGASARRPMPAAARLPGRRLRPSRSSRSSCTSDGISDSSLARWNQSAKPGSWRCWAWNSRTIIMRSQSGIGTSSERPPFSRNLRKACAVWFFLLGGKSLARSMKQLLSLMAVQHAVDLALEAAALGRPVAQEDARLRAASPPRAAA